MIALQCMSTVSILAKEMNSFKLAFLELLALNIIGYILAVAVVQLTQYLGWGQ
jgi:Fe2+ transport system protein B